MRLNAAYVGTAIAEYFRDVEGKDVLVTLTETGAVATLNEQQGQVQRFAEAVKRSPRALQLRRGRGLDETTIDDFRLGFAPDAREGTPILCRAAPSTRFEWHRASHGGELPRWCVRERALA